MYQLPVLISFIFICIRWKIIEIVLQNHNYNISCTLTDSVSSLGPTSCIFLIPEQRKELSKRYNPCHGNRTRSLACCSVLEINQEQIPEWNEHLLCSRLYTHMRQSQDLLITRDEESNCNFASSLFWPKHKMSHQT